MCVRKTRSEKEMLPVNILGLKILIHRNNVTTGENNWMNLTIPLVLHTECAGGTKRPRQDCIEFPIKVRSVEMQGFVIGVPFQLSFPELTN